MNLIFVADPMCSWCYGFAKELTQLSGAYPDLPIQIVVGGVRAGDTELMSEDMKQFRLTHWARVEKASGLVFNRKAFLALKNFVYDTEPVCRAVVAARVMAPTINLLSVFRRLQEAFYVDGKDTTDGEVLAAVAAEAMSQSGFPTSTEAFLDIWKHEEIRTQTYADFVMARRWGVSSFPALLLETNGQPHSVVSGYSSVLEVSRSLETVLHRVGYHVPVQSAGV